MTAPGHADAGRDEAGPEHGGGPADGSGPEHDDGAADDGAVGRSGVLARLRAVPRWVWGATAAIVVVVAVVVTIIVTTSGPDSPGDVAVVVGGQAVAVEPTVYCDVLVTDCEVEPSAVVALPLPPGTVVDVAVPPTVSETPWQVAFTYRDENGAEQSGRGELFGPNRSETFRLVLPDERWVLERVEVQQFGAVLIESPEGDLFSTRSTWVVAAE